MVAGGIVKAPVSGMWDCHWGQTRKIQTGQLLNPNLTLAITKVRAGRRPLEVPILQFRTTTDDERCCPDTTPAAPSFGTQKEKRLEPPWIPLTKLQPLSPRVESDPDPV